MQTFNVIFFLLFLHSVISRLPLLMAGTEISARAVKVRGKTPAQQGITYTVDDLLTAVGQ